MEEEISNDISDKGLVSKIYKDLPNSISKEQIIQSRNGQKTRIDISPRKTYKWPTDTWRCSISLTIKETKIKTTIRYHLKPVRMGNINNTNNRCWRGWGERGALLHCWWEHKLLQSLWKTVWSFLKKLKIELPYDPAIVLPGIYPKDTKIQIQRDTCTPMFMVALSALVKLWKEPKCPFTDDE